MKSAHHTTGEHSARTNPVSLSVKWDHEPDATFPEGWYMGPARSGVGRSSEAAVTGLLPG